MPAKIPHDRLSTGCYHLTYRLAGSVPKNIISQLSERRKRKLEQLEGQVMHLNYRDQQEVMREGKNRINTQYEIEIDQILHASRDETSFFLQQSEIANCVVESWHFLQGAGEICLWAVCVMGNHVHVVLSAGVSKETVNLGLLMENHKGYTARMANRILNRTGMPFWEPGYFDRRIREGKFQRVMWYVLNNPVKAKLVDHWTDWPATWVHPDYRPMFTGTV